MPYVITTRRPVDAIDCGHPEAPRDGWPIDRVAVATLDEAQHQAYLVVQRLYDSGAYDGSSDYMQQAATVLDGEQGGTVGPLPDGTVIEVEPTNWYELNKAAGLSLDDTVGDGVGRYTPADEATIVAAYNARSANTDSPASGASHSTEASPLPRLVPGTARSV